MSTAESDFSGIRALSSRGAGYAVAKKCLEVQAEGVARNPSLHTQRGVTLDPDAWSWYTGALGEIEVGKLLSALGPEWFVRHSIPIGAGTKDVDHLVIGPGGVFAINTKYHAAASVWVGDHVLRVNNVSKHYLSAGRGDGLDVSRRLQAKVGFPVPVRAVIAVLGSRSLKDARAPQERPVAVIDAAALIGWLQRQPTVLDDTTLGIIRLAAEEPETWHVDPHAADTFRVMQRFERLVAQVGHVTAPPTAAPTRSRDSAPPRRRPTRTARTQTTSTKRRFELLTLWAEVTIVVTVIEIVLGTSGGHCTGSTSACLIPTMLASLKPLMGLVVVAGLLTGLAGTLRLATRRRRR